MRTYIFAPRAECDLQAQTDYLNGLGAFDAAFLLAARIDDFIAKFLTLYPGTGCFVDLDAGKH